MESGLEHDLLKMLDRKQDVAWLLAQPVRLYLPSERVGRAGTHTLDPLSVHFDGSVTTWDARPDQRRDDLFDRKVELTGEACVEVGWRYETSAELPTASRMNLLWLNGFKRPMPWTEARRGELRGILSSTSSHALGVVVALDDGTGELISTMWHLIWSGEIVCDLCCKIDGRTELSWVPA